MDTVKMKQYIDTFEMYLNTTLKTQSRVIESLSSVLRQTQEAAELLKLVYRELRDSDD